MVKYMLVRVFVAVPGGHEYVGSYIGYRSGSAEHRYSSMAFNLYPGMDAPAEIPKHYRGIVDIPRDHDMRPIPKVFTLGNRKWRVIERDMATDSLRCVLDLPGSRLIGWTIRARWTALVILGDAMRHWGWLPYPEDIEWRIPTWRDIRPFGIGAKKHARR